MRKAFKNVISLTVVLIAGLCLTIPAFADPFTISIGLGGASSAGLFGSMSAASGFDIGFPSGTTADPADAMWNVLNPDYIYFHGETGQVTEPDPQTQIPTVYDYITVDIGDWLSAQSDFISEFASTHNVTDNSSGTVSVAVSIDGISPGTVLGKLNGPFTVGDAAPSVGKFQLRCIAYGSSKALALFYDNSVVYQLNNPGNYQYFEVTLVGYDTGQNKWTITANDPGHTRTVNLLLSTKDDGYTANWQSGTVNLDKFDDYVEPIVKIPHNSWSPSDPVNWSAQEFLYELTQKILNNAGSQIVIEDNGNPPVPPVPVPTTPLGDVPFDDWVDLWGQGIYQQLENQSDALDFIGSNGTDAIEELESIDENIGALEEAAESIDTNIGIGNGILGGIESLAQEAVDFLEGIAEHVGELVEEIVAGTETLIAGILNQIPQAFGVIFGPIKQASSIWHYVVEWITSIGAPFQFIWSMASGTSYYVILPVYASLAAAVVLAFFKRFGR